MADPTHEIEFRAQLEVAGWLEEMAARGRMKGWVDPRESLLAECASKALERAADKVRKIACAKFEEARRG